MTHQDYRNVAEKDALVFANELCKHQFSLGYAFFHIFINQDGNINYEISSPVWKDKDVKFSENLLQYLRKIGLTGHVVLSVIPEGDGIEFGIEIEVSDKNFYPIPPNLIQSSYNPDAYLVIGGQMIQPPRDPSDGRYYFPHILTYPLENGKRKTNGVTFTHDSMLQFKNSILKAN